MSNFIKESFHKLNDPFKWHEKGVGKVFGKPFGTLASEGIWGNADDLKAAGGSRTGSVLSGRAILQGGPKQQNMETARTFDVFGSPATAGGKQQTTARSLAALYGLLMGGAALAGGGGAGFGGTTSASAAPTASASGWSPFTTQMGYSGGTVGSGAGATTAASSSPSSMDYARMGNSMMQQGQQGGGTQQGALQHQYVGMPAKNPYMMGYPWS